MLPWFTKYPNQNDEILNLDWVIRQVENLKAAYEAFIAANSLTFADPIVWDITKQYSNNTIVLSPEGDAFLSKKAVGKGIQLNNSDYWLEIFNFAEYVRTANSNLTMNIEQNTTRATDAYAVDDWLLWEDVLYKVTAAIAVDDLLTVGTNIVHFTVEDFCRAWQTYMINTIAQYKRDIDASELEYKNEIDASELAYKNQLDATIANTTASLQAQLAEAIAGATVDSEVINIRIGANGITYDSAGDSVRNQFTLNNNVDKNIIGYQCIQSDFAQGNYTSSGPNTDPTRAYQIITGVSKGSKILFDPNYVAVNYYYITAVDDYTSKYSPNTWDTTGNITLNYEDNGIVFIVLKSTEVGVDIGHALATANQYTEIYKHYNGIFSNALELISLDLKEASENIDFALANQSFKRVATDVEIGGYTSSGPNADPTRVHMVLTDVDAGSRIYFDATKYAINYYYVVSSEDWTTIYTPNAWDTTGEVILSHLNTGTVVLNIKNLDSTNLTSLIDDINDSFDIFISTEYRANWVAFGDSITYGVISTGAATTEEGTSYADYITENVKPNTFARFYNCSVRGIGWVNTGNEGEDFDDMLALYTGEPANVKLVTIMLGINDYLSLEVIGDESATDDDGTISGAVKSGLKKIAQEFYKAKVVVISPLNSTSYGTVDNGYCRGTSLNNPHSLQDVSDIIAYWADKYGIQFINELSEGFINNYNIGRYLLDGLHPSQEGQIMLAKELAAKISLD